MTKSEREIDSLVEFASRAIQGNDNPPPWVLLTGDVGFAQSLCDPTAVSLDNIALQPEPSLGSDLSVINPLEHNFRGVGHRGKEERRDQCGA